ncbi:hypothetical protein TanjilG_24833 [Lupinus angustifolius]|uniref:C2H2-type domain-containing protein n=1 Tax=Lupinus angustifolius TaxID=3871 RepID=A0A1J7ID66_LUPAN|nr:PREDICTED: protein indeterminate-domain 7-like [Lupinus angustifolius]XP_019443110.1 PREDICTED: protein indeterminate-domain 7-like [Lupinus angustifolius]OIW12085.1 hypothetical protein TanjilG_24833 [Lupinus angustifolius]
MEKGLVVDENMSNLTSASSEISASSGSRSNTVSLYSQYSSTSTDQEPLPKKKRSLPGHPDPEAEVIALSPKSLIATNRFICEICEKGFQRDQNLQLHKRGHNLPWKLKQRNSKEPLRKKVYVCPEPTCVHHDPSRALGDLTGIKKHFFRKHGEKKWKCEKCSKRYAVQSDWKAHSKICGTREYKCDCGTLFSRRDSFITHRAFCDALAQESAVANVTTMNPLLSSHTQLLHSHDFQAPSLVKREQGLFNIPTSEIPPWLVGEPIHSQVFKPLDFSLTPLLPTHYENPNPTTVLPSFQPNITTPSLMQKASSQMGATVTKTAPSTAILRPHLLQQQGHVHECTTTGYSSSFMASSSREEISTVFSHGLTAPYGNKAAMTSANTIGTDQESSLFHDMMGGGGGSSGTVHNASGFDNSSFEEAMRGMFNNPPRDDHSNFEELVSKSAQSQFGNKSNKGVGVSANGEMTRDFLSLGAFSQRDFFNISGLDHLDSSSYGKQNHNQAPWQG